MKYVVSHLISYSFLNMFVIEPSVLFSWVLFSQWDCLKGLQGSQLVLLIDKCFPKQENVLLSNAEVRHEMTVASDWLALCGWGNLDPILDEKMKW